MKGQWRVVYRFKFPWNPRAGQWRSRVFNTEEAANKFLQDVCALHDAEGKVQPATFRLPRNIAITIDGKIVKRNPMKRSKIMRQLSVQQGRGEAILGIPHKKTAKLEFIAYLERTLIPDLKESGHEYTAEDFETLVHALKGHGFPFNGWNSNAQFETYLRNTLIPDLRKSGREFTAKDFATGLRYMGATAYRMRKNPKMTRSQKRMIKSGLKPSKYAEHIAEKGSGAIQAWDVLIDAPGGYKVLDTISYIPEMTADDVRHQLIARDHYPDNIIVRKAGKRQMKKNPMPRFIQKHIDRYRTGQAVEKHLNKNPHKRSSKKPLSAKQKAAREKFVKMVRSGAFKKRGRNAPKRDPFGGYARRKKINPVRRKRARKVKAAKFILCLPRIGDSRMWYYGAKANQVTTVKADAKVFRTEMGALSEARAHKFRLAKHGFFEARTQRI